MYFQIKILLEKEKNNNIENILKYLKKKYSNIDDIKNKLQNSFYYSSSLSLFTPPAMAYNMSKLYKIPISRFPICKETFRILPSQFTYRFLQYGIFSFISDKTNPWIGFGLMGISQGFIYGKVNNHWTKVLQQKNNSLISKNIQNNSFTTKSFSTKSFRNNSFRNSSFRGSFFAASRDIISQGIPYQFNTPLSVLNASLFSTVASQCFHNFQTVMQVNTKLNYQQAVKYTWEKHGIELFWKGSSARIGLMLLINIINQKFLK